MTRAAMDPSHLDELAHIERHYWWHVTKRGFARDALLRFAPPPGFLVEGGFGGGESLRAFQSLGYSVKGLDSLPAAVALAQQSHVRAAVHDLAEPWPVPTATARAVVLLDVIEHVDDPVGVLGHARDALSSGGAAVVSVPAMPGLFGPWDEMLGHKRRYSRALLEDHARRAGLRVAWVTGWNVAALPAAVAIRRVERFVGGRRGVEFPPVTDRVNRLLCAAGALERRVACSHPLPFGLSLMAVMVP